LLHTRRDMRYFSYTLTTTPTTDIYTLSLHDALPISRPDRQPRPRRSAQRLPVRRAARGQGGAGAARAVHADAVHGGGVGCAHARSEEHTSELQSRENLVCRLLLEKKKKNTNSKANES